MAKKNFDTFINSAGKKPKPTPEEVEEMAKQLHGATTPMTIAPAPVPQPATPPASTKSPVAKQKSATQPVVNPKGASRQSLVATRPPSTVNRQVEAPKEKVRITIDLAKDLYKRMKLAVVENETEISAYIRQLIENDLNRKKG
jgi:hypothetical protein